MDVRLVITTLPTDDASRVARALVEERLIACANLLPPATSVYRWEGEVREDAEVLALLKTAESRVEALVSRLSELHPYDVPEILVVPVTGGLEAYLRWVGDETS